MAMRYSQPNRSESDGPGRNRSPQHSVQQCAQRKWLFSVMGVIDHLARQLLILFMDGSRTPICMVSHHSGFARHARREVHLFDGKAVSETELEKL